MSNRVWQDGGMKMTFENWFLRVAAMAKGRINGCLDWWMVFPVRAGATGKSRGFVAGESGAEATALQTLREKPGNGRFEIRQFGEKVKITKQSQIKNAKIA